MIFDRITLLIILLINVKTKAFVSFLPPIQPPVEILDYANSLVDVLKEATLPVIKFKYISLI